MLLRVLMRTNVASARSKGVVNVQVIMEKMHGMADLLSRSFTTQGYECKSVERRIEKED